MFESTKLNLKSKCTLGTFLPISYVVLVLCLHDCKYLTKFLQKCNILFPLFYSWGTIGDWRAVSV